MWQEIKTGAVFAVVAAFCLAVWAFAAYGAYAAFMLPTVTESYRTGECVTVDDPRGVYSCENMPKKFHHVWLP